MRRFILVTAILISLTAILSSCDGPEEESKKESNKNSAEKVESFIEKEMESESANGPTVRVWVTTPEKSKLLSEEEQFRFGVGSGEISAPITIHVDESVTYQQMDGFGAAMTDSSAWLIANKLNLEQREKLMRDLFDHEQGIGISYMRLPMGASDFAHDFYTYNDKPAGEIDPKLKGFSIEHDKAYIIPALKQAREINPDLKLMASPWSVPAWMKSSESLITGYLKEEFYPSYANYFVKFIQGYEAEGVPMDAITLQNEPYYEPPGYPGMFMDATEQIEVIRNHLGPAFRDNGITTKIITWDHNWDHPEYPIQVLDDPEANAFISGSAFHGYTGEVRNQQQVHDAHPDKDIYFTESSGGEWATDFGNNLKWDLQNLIIGSTRYWSKVVLKWNLALDEDHGPKKGGCQDCRGFVTINSQSGEVTLNEEYYAFGHASKFVKSGAYRIETNQSEVIENVAFKNPDGSKVLIGLNSSTESQLFEVHFGDQKFTYTLPAGAVATFVW